jgi:uncharacterized protein YgbK (DUF1537 family)
MSLLLSFYGDDFTGSTDVMEAMASHGVKTVLLTRQPTAEEFEPFKNYQAIGLAGSSRSQTPEWMDENLPPVFDWLKSLNARFCHYKVCSTFDSSPKTGSIGRAIEIALRIFPQTSVPLIVGVPQLKRYTFAGHLFADYQGQIYRIDRHPAMSKHPVTPMDESDLRVHLARQTQQTVEVIDVNDEKTQRSAGEHLLELTSPFVVGSSGVEYALIAAMIAQQQMDGRAHFADLPAVERTIVVSGSVSPTTGRQISYAIQHGFVALEADPEKLAQQGNQIEMARLRAAADAALAKGLSPIVYTALGPATDRGDVLDKVTNGRQQIAKSLGRLARDCMERNKLSRIILAGGDTSSHALGELDIHALTTRFPLMDTPGSPLCLAHSTNKMFQHLEVAMKGGQVGGDDYFVKLKGAIRN